MSLILARFMSMLAFSEPGFAVTLFLVSKNNVEKQSAVLCIFLYIILYTHCFNTTSERLQITIVKISIQYIFYDEMRSTLSLLVESIALELRKHQYIWLEKLP